MFSWLRKIFGKKEKSERAFRMEGCTANHSFVCYISEGFDKANIEMERLDGKLSVLDEQITQLLDARKAYKADRDILSETINKQRVALGWDEVNYDATGE